MRYLKPGYVKLLFVTFFPGKREYKELQNGANVKLMNGLLSYDFIANSLYFTTLNTNQNNGYYYYFLGNNLHLCNTKCVFFCVCQAVFKISFTWRQQRRSCY